LAGKVNSSFFIGFNFYRYITKTPPTIALTPTRWGLVTLPLLKFCVKQSAIIKFLNRFMLRVVFEHRFKSFADMPFALPFSWASVRYGTVGVIFIYHFV